MQRIPTLYGFSIIILVLVLMIFNHIIYMEILERSLDNRDYQVEAVRPPAEVEVDTEESAELEEVGEVETEAEAEVEIETEGAEQDINE